MVTGMAHNGPQHLLLMDKTGKVCVCVCVCVCVFVCVREHTSVGSPLLDIQYVPLLLSHFIPTHTLTHTHTHTHAHAHAHAHAHTHMHTHKPSLAVGQVKGP